MKIAQAQTAIDCFHGRVQSDKKRQQKLILDAMYPYISYTGQELSHMTGLPPNIISARMFELRESGEVVRPMDVRKLCPHSKVNVYVHYKPAGQMELVA